MSGLGMPQITDASQLDLISFHNLSDGPKVTFAHQISRALGPVGTFKPFGKQFLSALATCVYLLAHMLVLQVNLAHVDINDGQLG